jgi:hypothetical protein
MEARSSTASSDASPSPASRAVTILSVGVRLCTPRTILPLHLHRRKNEWDSRACRRKCAPGGDTSPQLSEEWALMRLKFTASCLDKTVLRRQIRVDALAVHVPPSPFPLPPRREREQAGSRGQASCTTRRMGPGTPGSETGSQCQFSAI